MSRHAALSSVTVLSLMAAAGCGDWHSDPDGFTERDLVLTGSMVLQSAAPDPGNEFADDERARALGQKLFFDLGLAIRADGKSIACASCHSPKVWFSDPNHTSLATGLGVTGRNSPSLVNVGFYNEWGWDGRSDSIWAQSSVAFESSATMRGSAATVYARVLAVTDYEEDFNAAFSSAPDGGALRSLTAAQAYPFILKAWGAYIGSLQSRRAPFDLWASGEDRNALNAQQKRGLRLFIGKAGCIECHSGPTFTDGVYRSVGVSQNGVPDDWGRWEGLAVRARLADAGFTTKVPERKETDQGQFRTKSLRQVAMTGPYFHAGQAQTLKDVVWFYNQGGDHAGIGAVSNFIVPLGLTDEEQADLVVFLGALTGEPVDPALTCDKSSAHLFRTFESGFVDADGGVLLPDGGLVASDGGAIQLRNGGTFTQFDGGFFTTDEPLKREFEACTKGSP